MMTQFLVLLAVAAFSAADAVPSCEKHRMLGAVTSGYFEIDPDEDGPLAPFSVWCDLSTPSVKTRVFHNRETRTAGPKTQAPYAATLSLTYHNGSISQIRSLVERSATCSYSFKYECYGAYMSGYVGLTGFNGSFYGSWWRTYGGGLCQEVATLPGETCKCDINDEVWRSEEGLIDFKMAFPITSFKIGDTDAATENSYLTLGYLTCQEVRDDRNWFKISSNKRYTGPGEFLTTENPSCKLSMCTVACVSQFHCQAAGLSKTTNCRCHLYDKDYLNSSNNVTVDTQWDLVVIIKE